MDCSRSIFRVVAWFDQRRRRRRFRWLQGGGVVAAAKLVAAKLLAAARPRALGSSSRSQHHCQPRRQLLLLLHRWRRPNIAGVSPCNKSTAAEGEWDWLQIEEWTQTVSIRRAGRSDWGSAGKQEMRGGTAVGGGDSAQGRLRRARRGRSTLDRGQATNVRGATSGSSGATRRVAPHSAGTFTFRWRSIRVLVLIEDVRSSLDGARFIAVSDMHASVTRRLWHACTRCNTTLIIIYVL